MRSFIASIQNNNIYAFELLITKVGDINARDFIYQITIILFLSKII